MQNFLALGAPPPNLQPPAARGLAPELSMAFGGTAPRLPKHPPLRIFGYERLNVV